MYCGQCGEENKDDALFCKSCGAGLAGSAAAQPFPAQPEGGLPEEQQAQAGSFKSAVESSRKRSLRRIPTIVLIALITLLVSSVAFAACLFVTEVLSPQQRAQVLSVFGIEEKPEYSVESEEVSISRAYDSGQSIDFSEETDVWHIDVLRTSIPSSSVDAINAEVRQNFEQFRHGAENIVPGEEQNVQAEYRITYLSDEYVSFRCLQSVYPVGQAKTYTEAYGMAFSLETGERVDPWSVVGVDGSQLGGKTFFACGASANKIGEPVSSEWERRSQSARARLVSEFETNTNKYYLTSEGLAYSLRNYELGSIHRWDLIVEGFDEANTGNVVDTSAWDGAVTHSTF